jgi:DNA (cytosine-5)-methyltransferase 1
MRHGSLFSGIGGFDLAAEWMGWENVFHCEWMEFPRKVLDYYWPDADSHVDICKTDFTKYANTIDILTGGFPCQPFSLAGKRKGTDDERYLWGEMLRAIREIKPKWVIAENVFGIVNIDGGMVFEQVCLDLENEGYEVQPFIIPAAAKNAPHRRDRVWFVAYNVSKGLQGSEQAKKSGENTNRLFGNRATGSDLWGKITNIGNERPAPDTESKSSERMRPKQRKSCESEQGEFGGINSENGSYRPTPDTSNQGLQGIQDFGSIGASGPKPHKQSSRFIQSTWQNFPTQSPICSGNDGLPSQLDGITFPKWRNESIKGYGNAIVPQIAYQLFQIIEHESKNKTTQDKQAHHFPHE